jgi:lipopolysaccharide/colanic/teichoic acid biosynthesis glycosyltransferase
VAVDIQQRHSASEPRSTPRESTAINAGNPTELERPLPFWPVFIRHRWYLPVKASAEFAFALVLLLVLLPLIGVLALLVKLTSRGPAFYKQRRVGQYGQHFMIVKLRTMVDNCESLTGPRWCIPGDPRVTWVGHFLRITHLDELPQLINVLRGEMGIIGPRPERPEFLPKLERSLPGYRDRLLVRPGVTGLAQVQLPADTDLESVRRKLQYDLFYVQWVNPWLDVRILFCTALHVLGVPFKIAGKLLGIPSSEVVETAEQPAVTETALPRPRIAA